MKKIYLIISALSIAVFFTACGGGEDNASFTGEVKTTIPLCPTTITYKAKDRVTTDGDVTIQIVNTPKSKEICQSGGTGKSYLE
jgi:uncharacterized lipoprotein YehR (DUF1307 family)